MSQFIETGTVCAISTPPGVGGITVLRLSGDQALSIARKICPFLPSQPQSHSVYFGALIELQSGIVIDEVLVTYFANGKSYTGEETCEISCHGNPIIAGNILQELVKAGARLANAGEFTYRAFMNGKIDLVQAESVLSVIESQSKVAARLAVRQLRGSLSHDFGRIENDLTWILAHLEASIDFSSEGIEVIPSRDLLAKAKSLTLFLEKLIDSYDQGKAIREGIQVALVGRPNVGKSSLLNALLREERAIVTDEPGTTRDTIEGRIFVNGIPVTFVDTAGLRETENTAEKIGIERSRRTIADSDLVFYVVDLQNGLQLEDVQLIDNLKHPTVFLLVNKIDLNSTTAKRDLLMGVLRERTYFLEEGQLAWISAKTGEGLSQVQKILESRVNYDPIRGSQVVTLARHHEALRQIHACLIKAMDQIVEDRSPEFIAFELQQGIRLIHELLGKEFHEQVIDRIFKEFCLGK